MNSTTLRAALGAACLVAAALLGACGGGSPYDFQQPALDAKEEESNRLRYLELVKASVTDSLYWGPPRIEEAEGFPIGKYHGSPRAYSLLTHDRFDNLYRTMTDVLARDVPGDFIEAGAWRGGATIYMRAVLEAYGVHDRKVFVADSFEGFPEPDPDIKVDAGFGYRKDETMVAPIDQVRQAFDRYGLLDDQVVFLKGWFSDTLPTAPIDKLAVLRVDADMYEGTMDALVHLYPKLSSGGYVIIDDYGLISACKKAVDDYREQNGITTEWSGAGWSAIYWQKP